MHCRRGLATGVLALLSVILSGCVAYDGTDYYARDRVYVDRYPHRYHPPRYYPPHHGYPSARADGGFVGGGGHPDYRRQGGFIGGSGHPVYPRQGGFIGGSTPPAAVAQAAGGFSGGHATRVDARIASARSPSTDERTPILQSDRVGPLTPADGGFVSQRSAR